MIRQTDGKPGGRGGGCEGLKPGAALRGTGVGDRRGEAEPDLPGSASAGRGWGAGVAGRG
jgi:hypothetical protein